MSYLGATVGIAAAGAGAGVLTGITATKNALMGGVLIAEGMMTGTVIMKAVAGGIEAEALVIAADAAEVEARV